jgi:hypothetical protein
LKGTEVTDLETLKAAAERIAAHNVQLRSFLLELTDPEGLGHAVTVEVRRKAAVLLSMQHVKVVKDDYK